MFAIARLNTFDEQRLAAAGMELNQFNQLHASQPGYAGSLTIALGADTRLTVNLWENEQHAQAALDALGSDVGRVLAPLMNAPSQLLGAGTVETDLILAPSARASEPW